MTKHHEHHHSTKHSARVDLKKEHVYLGGKIYHWEDLEESFYGGYSSPEQRVWSRVSQKRCKKNGREIPFVPEGKRDTKHDWEDVERTLDDEQDRHLIRKLKKAVQHAKHEGKNEQEPTPKELQQLQRDVFALEAVTHPSPVSDSGVEDESASAEKPTPWQKHTKGGPPAKGKRIERTKYGVRIWTTDGNTYWDICVGNSTNVPGAAAIRLTLPPPRKDGKPFNMGLFDLEAIEALRREIDRGPKPKKP